MNIGAVALLLLFPSLNAVAGGKVAPAAAGAFYFGEAIQTLINLRWAKIANSRISQLLKSENILMNIEEQVALLMQGTEYGDEQLKKNMALELHQRLIEVVKNIDLCGFIVALILAHRTCTWVIQSQCGNSANFRNLDTKSHSSLGHSHL